MQSHPTRVATRRHLATTEHLLLKHTRVEQLTEQMAHWALEYRSAENHDTDLVGVVADIAITVGTLRKAFERYYLTPFKTFQFPPQEAANE